MNDINLSSPKWELVNFCEFDKYAVQSYCAIHGVDESLNLGDITQVDETKLEPFTFMCFGFPCQDISVAGKQAGIGWKCNDCGYEYNPLTVHYSERNKCPHCGSENIDKTRSSLVVEALRILKSIKPTWGIIENVKNLVSKKNKEGFDLLLNELHEYGYSTHYKVLNAKDYGVPQNRERVYILFIKAELDNGKFEWPEPFDNGLRLKDILEDEVDEKYYVNTPKAAELINDLLESGKLDKEFSNSVRGGQRKLRQTSMGYD